jgi:hypothetical protein
MHDISKNADYKAALDKMKQHLDGWIVATRDTEMMKK